MSSVGERHRRQRKMLNPVFSPRNLKEMLPVFYKVIHKVRFQILCMYSSLSGYCQLRDAIAAQLQGGAKELDVLQWTNRGALEVMGQAGLGYSFDSLQENSSNEFARALKGLLWVPLPSLRCIRDTNDCGSPAMQRIGFVRTFTPLFLKMGPRGVRRRLAQLVASVWTPARQLLAVVDTLDLKAQEILEAKRRAMVGKEGDGRDLMACLRECHE